MEGIKISSNIYLSSLLVGFPDIEIIRNSILRVLMKYMRNLNYNWKIDKIYLAL